VIGRFRNSTIAPIAPTAHANSARPTTPATASACTGCAAKSRPAIIPTRQSTNLRANSRRGRIPRRAVECSPGEMPTAGCHAATTGIRNSARPAGDRGCRSPVEIVVGPELAPQFWMLDALVEADEVGIVVDIGAAEGDGVERKRQRCAECRWSPVFQDETVIPRRVVDSHRAILTAGNENAECRLPSAE